MRKYKFDNLAITDVFSPMPWLPFSDVSDFSSHLNTLAAPPPLTPLFANIDGTSGNDTLNGTPGDDIMNGLGGADIFNGFAGDDLFIAGFSDLEFNGGDGYDEIRFDYGVDGSFDSDFFIDFRDYDIDSIEEITLNPTWVSGGAGSVTYFFEFGTSQFDQLQRFDFLAYGDVQIWNDGANSLDLSDFDSPVYSGLFTVYGGFVNGETFTLTIDQDPVDFFAGAGQDTIIGLQDATQYWRFVADGDYQSTSIDTIDFSQMATVPNGSIGTQGQITYDLSNNNITQTGLGLATASNATVINFEIFIGWDGKDIFIGDEGDNTFIGNGGENIAVYSSSNVLDYAVNEIAPGQYTIEAIGSTGEGTDTLTDIQTIRLGGVNGTDYDIAVLAGNNGDIDLTDGDDTYSGTMVDEVINGLDGDDIIDGDTGNNTLNGDSGDDTLISLGNDVINGGVGNDLIEMGGNVFDVSTLTDGGADIDTISFSTLAQIPSGNLFLVIDLQGQAYSVRDFRTVLYVDQFTNFENATGSEYRDLLQGDAGGNVLSGLAGNDVLQGRDGDDSLFGGSGDDSLSGGAGMDILDGGEGFDVASYTSSASAIVYGGLGLIASTGDIADDTLINIEAIEGTAFNDRLYGGNEASIFYGGEGNDRLFGRNGDDMLYGEGGNDIIIAGRDNDLLDGGGGNDQLRGNQGDDTIYGGDGNDSITGGAGADFMDGGAGIDRVQYTYGTNAGVTASLGDSSINTGDAVGDTYVNVENLYGTSFDDILYGDAGNNRVDGRVGDDLLFGGDGNDYLIGGSGDDIMNGEGGNDLFLGQAGADIYQFDAAHGTDRIVVFTQGEDLIEFTESVFDFSNLAITQDGAHVNIDTGEGTIIVNNSLVADFTSDDFIFAAPAQEPLDMGEQDMAIYVEVDALI